MDKEKGPETDKINTEIDFSAIKNKAAVSKKDKGFADVASSFKKKSKYQFVEPELIQLPSKGKLYNTNDEDILHGFIKLFPMTVKEEEILSTPRYLKSGSATRMVIENCLASDFPARDVLLFDSNFLLYRLRQISYGDDYEFKLTCGNSMCKHEFDHKLKISDLKFEELPDDFEEPIVVKLPRSKYTVTSILPRLAHSEELTMRNANRIKKSDESDTRQVDNLIITTVSITAPDGSEVPRRDWEDFYSSLVGIDAGTLREKTSLTTGIDKFEAECPYCGEVYKGSVPIGAEFFRF